jgi:hypothetical protein
VSGNPETPDPRLTRLRSLVASVERKLDGSETNPGALRVAWDDLVKALALGPEPELRACPSCARAIIREASRCRYCWIRSDAGAALPAEHVPGE